MSFTKSNDLAYATNKFLDGYTPTHPIFSGGGEDSYSVCAWRRISRRK